MTDASEPALEAAIAAYRKKLGPELTEAFLVLIIGHTDSTGDEGHNMRLSLARADSVAEHLISTEQRRMLLRLSDSRPTAL